MEKNYNPYSAFSNFVLRTPIFPLSFYRELTKNPLITKKKLFKLFHNNEIKESIFIASPVLYLELDKCFKNVLNPEREKKAMFSFLKYLVRMSSRCTPFGLFSGCSLGIFSEETNINIREIDNYKRFTRPDMNYLVTLSYNLAEREHIKSQINYFPNTSIYKLGEELRYIEYSYDNNHRSHRIVEINITPYLDKVLTKSKGGANLKLLAKELVNEEITEADALQYLNDLIENQILVSELEPSVSGNPLIDQITEILGRLENCDKELAFLNRLKFSVDNLDQKIGNNPDDYFQLAKYLEQYPASFELRYLFQVDLEPTCNEAILSNKLISDIKVGMELFNKIYRNTSDNNLSKFRDAFYERYEDREMALCEVMDSDIGIGYLQDMVISNMNPLVDDLFLPEIEDPLNQETIPWNSFNSLIVKKIIEAAERDEKKIVLDAKDIENLPTNWDDLPNTIYTVIELITENCCDKIKISGFSGNAARILGRFCHSNSEIHKLVAEIVEFENEIENEKILAEIVHLPQTRAGNILMRPILRKYEIPYLAKSNVEDDFQISIQDLFVSVKNNRIILRSKKYDKEVLPHLTNAHNYSTDQLPLYQFLCDMQFQDKRENIGFNYYPLSHMFSFLPRLEYKNLIIHEAIWFVQGGEIEPLLSAKSNDEILTEQIILFREKINLPYLVYLEENGTDFLIDLRCLTLVRLMLKLIKKKENFILKEFLHNENGKVKSRYGSFANQIFIPFYDSRNLRSTEDL